MLPPSLILFIVLYILSFLMVMNSDDWILIWIGLEINMMSFVFLIYKRESIFNVECCLKYFFIQSLGSALLLNIFYMNNEWMMYLGSMIMSYKMGAGMFFFWFPSICSGIEWGSCFILMTFQKVIPMILISLMISWVVWIIMMISLIVGALGSLNQTNIKRLMAYSSIHHIGWMLMCLKIEDGMWILYLILYMIVIFPIMLMLNRNKLFLVVQMNFFKNKYLFIMMMLSMAGMPPFLGFFLKWMVFYKLFMKGFLMLMFMIFLSVLMFYIYVRIIYSMFLGMEESMMWEKGSIFKYNLTLNLMSIMGMVLGLSFMLFLLY